MADVTPADVAPSAPFDPAAPPPPRRSSGPKPNAKEETVAVLYRGPSSEFVVSDYHLIANGGDLGEPTVMPLAVLERVRLQFPTHNFEAVTAE